MGVTYEQCAADVRQVLDTLIEKYHSPLSAAAVTIDLTFAVKFDADGNPLPAVKLHGVAASAKVKITSLEDRARGIADAKIIIDRHEWTIAKPQTRAAILDHELTHLTLKDEGEPDDLGRPKLKLRDHDWMVWGFDVIAERYKDFAPETSAMKNALEHFKQLSLFDSAVESPIAAVDAALRRGKGIDKVTITTKIPGREAVSISSDDLEEK